MRKILLLIMTFVVLTNVNAQDITTGLVFHLTANEDIAATVTSSDASAATGTVKFSDTEEVEGDASNASITHSQGVDGTANGAFNIGTGSYIEFQAADINGLPVGSVGTSGGVDNPNGSDRTYAAWIKGTNLAGNIFSYGNPSAGEHVHMHLQDDGTTVKLGHWSHDWEFNDLATYNDDKWHHIVLKVYETIDNVDFPKDYPEIELFVDGVSQGAKPHNHGSSDYMNTNITEPGYTTLTVGMRNTIEKDYVGEIDDLRIYNRALTTEEIETLFANKGAVSLSVNTVDKKTDFKVYLTNANTLKVESNVEIDGLSIISLTGAIVKEMNTNEFVDISELASGLYIIVGQSKNGRSTAKFIKQ